MGQRMQPKPRADTLSPLRGFSRMSICSGPSGADAAFFFSVAGAQAAATAAAPDILMKSLLFMVLSF